MLYSLTQSQLDEAMRHPMWETQVLLEAKMQAAGRDAAQRRLDRAIERDQISRLSPARRLISEALPKVIAGMDDYLRTCARSRGPKPIALTFFTSASGTPYVVSPPSHPRDDTSERRVSVPAACLIALRTLMDGVAAKGNHIPHVAELIGSRCEHEAKVAKWCAEEPELFHKLQDFMDRDGATSDHRARVNLNRFNKMLKDGKFGFGWAEWSRDEKFRVGVALMDNIVRITRWFHYEADEEYAQEKFTRGTPRAAPLCVFASSQLAEWMGKSLRKDADLAPTFEPTVIPPKPWTGYTQGGYWTAFMPQTRLVEFKAAQAEQRRWAADEYDALDMPEVYDALNFIQDTPWRVNSKVLEVVRWASSLHMPIGKEFPSKPAFEKTPKPLDIETNPQALIKWKRDEKERIKRGLKLASKWALIGQTLGVAERYADYPAIYFPHKLDFRGRMYPIPMGLQPQGDDLARGLLEFAEGKPVTEDSEAWLAINVATAFGVDKVSFEDRLAWVNERHDLWLAIARDPKECREWADQKKPWQALAAALDLAGYLTHGSGYVSHAVVSVDGTCNGIQHLSAMTLDEVAGGLVNLVPNEKPADIYQHVANLLREDVERIAGGPSGDAAEHAQWWLDVFPDGFTRDMTKRQVMVLPYGGTKDSFFTYTRKWLDEVMPPQTEWDAGSEEERSAYFKLRFQRLAFLVNRLWDIVKSQVRGGMGVMEWLQACAKHCTEANQPIVWVTPSGFVVRHFYGRVEEQCIKVKLDGSDHVLRRKVSTKDLDIQSQLRGIAPNFVHSLDASCLVTCINAVRRRGVTAFSAIHDSYGTHAADMWTLFAGLREAFVHTHNAQPLREFRSRCQSIRVGIEMLNGAEDPMEADEIADSVLPRMPDLGDLDLDEVLRSDYFFA
jgi:DNA-directed RNA polymerase, mitochondrial